jgi:hypothetical protein
MNINDKINEIKSDFCFLFVGHWLKGKLGEDRKNVGMLIKCFVDTFKNQEKKPALILKTSMGTYSVSDRELIRKKILEIIGDVINPPEIHLLYGELTDIEMNELYNHPKVKVMVSLTKGEGFSRPLLEFSLTGKPIIASNWSGHKDFLPMDKTILIGGKLTDVDESAVDKFILKNSKWFTPNYDEVNSIFFLIFSNYNDFLIKSEELRIINEKEFSYKKMTDKFKEILIPYVTKSVKVEMKLPKLIKIDERI